MRDVEFMDINYFTNQKKNQLILKTENNFRISTEYSECF